MNLVAVILFLNCQYLLGDGGNTKTGVDEKYSSQASTVFTRSTSPDPSCTCDTNGSSLLVENAKKMMDQVQNKTMLNKIKHRATHSNDAIWACICLSSLLMLLVLGLLQSKMWSDQTFLSYPESQPAKYEQYNQEAEVKVKYLLKSQGRKLLKYFSKKRKHKREVSNSFQMETFIQSQCDEVDSVYKELIESSDDDNDTDSEEEVVFHINTQTGMWESGRQKFQHSVRPSGDSRGRYSLVTSSVSKDLSRLSESSNDTKESEPLISI